MPDKRSAIRFLSILSLVLILLRINVSARERIFVSGDGSDTHPGTVELPLKSIQAGIAMLGSGDTLFIREGSYHEEIFIESLHGNEVFPVIIMAYPGEKVILDGTEDVDSLALGDWSKYKGSVYKRKLKKGTWQLFDNNRLQVIARWPDAETHPCDPIVRKPDSWEAEDGNWWSKETTWANADMPGTGNGTVVNNPAYHDLAGTGLSFEGGSVILSVLEQGGDGNEERPVTAHEAGSNVFSHPALYPADPEKAFRVDKKFFLLEHLNALDKPGEWYYTYSDSMLYLWTEDGQAPGKGSIRGRTITHSVEILNSSYISLVGIDFFASNFSIDASNIRVENCHLSYPDATQRLLGIYSDANRYAPTRTFMFGPYNSLVNSVIEFTELGALVCKNAEGSVLHNNLFHHISIRGMGKNGAIEQVNTYSRNTLHTCGTRAGVKTNEDPMEGRIQKYNLFDGMGYLQTPDGAALQVATNKTPGTIRSHNWFLNSPKYGSRWDGRPAGINGTNHHQVGVGCNAALQVKGDDHDTHNNTCLDSPEKNDILIISDLQFGGNQNSRTYNNLADRISGDRTLPYSRAPVPGKYYHNWNGYETGRDANDQLMDVRNRDFRPWPGSLIIDGGMEITGITDGFSGYAPDIGAYESGDTEYWIPGRQERLASSPVPAHNDTAWSEFIDLMWLEAYGSDSSDLYFGTDSIRVLQAGQGEDAYAGRYTVNKWNPGSLEAGKKYFWRVDALMPEGRLKRGDVWSFIPKRDANPEVFSLQIMVWGKSEDQVFPLDATLIDIGGWQRISVDGKAGFRMIRPGQYFYSITRENFEGVTGDFSIGSDAILIDTLRMLAAPVDTLHDISFRLFNRSDSSDVSRAVFNTADTSLMSNHSGIVFLDAASTGTIDYEISHSDYFMLSGSVEVNSDSVFYAGLTPLVADVWFMVQDVEGPKSEVSVTMDGRTLYSDHNGMVPFLHKPARTKYTYMAESEGFEIIQSELYLELDTLVEINLRMENSVREDPGPLNRIWPNPASDKIFLTGPEKGYHAMVWGLSGRIVYSEWIDKEQFIIDSSRWPAGMYTLQLSFQKKTRFYKIMISR